MEAAAAVVVVVVPPSPAVVEELAAAVVVVDMVGVDMVDGVRLRMDGKHFCRFRSLTISSFSNFPFLLHSSHKYQPNLVPSLLFVPAEWFITKST